MEDSCVCTRDANNFDSCCSPSSPHSIFSLKYSDLPNSRYSYFLYGFTDERDFEEFKKDLRNFQKLKGNCSALYNNNNNNSATALPFQGKDEDSENEFNEDLEIICRQNTARKSRRRNRGSFNEGDSRRKCQPETPVQHFHSSDSELYVSQPTPRTPLRVKQDLAQQTQTRVSPISNADHTRPDSFGLRGDFDRRSLAFGYGRRSGFPSSINDILMEFINGDEHFLEFERVFETVNNRRNTRDRNARFSRRMSAYRENQKSASSPDRHRTTDRDKADDNEGAASGPVTFIDDTFADFFDNDEDFLAFEKELEKFRASRFSKQHGSISSFGSSRDIFGDVRSYCDRSLNKLNTGSLVSVNSCTSSGEAAPSCSVDDHGGPDVGWKSMDDWEKMFHKMRRNSRLFSDSKYQANYKRGCHRHSMSGLSKVKPWSDQYQRTQSLADIPGRCDDSLPSSNSPSSQEEHRSVLSGESSSPLSRVPASNSVDTSLEQQTAAAYDSSDSDVNSCDIWSDSYVDDGDIRYSSSSTLCSTHDDCVSFSPSCSCSSDLHINEDIDEDFPFLSSSPSKQRSQSFQDLSKTQPKLDPMVQSGSLKKWLNSARDPIPSDLPTSSQSQPSFDHLQPEFLHPIGPAGYAPEQQLSTFSGRQPRTPTGSMDFLVDPDDGDERWDTDSGGVLSTTSIASSLNLKANATDGESDHFYSAKSDFSERFHTAKSDFPSHRRQSGYLGHRALAAQHRSQSADLSGLSSLENSDRGSRVDAWLTSELDAADTRHHDCQYTCHQLCVPTVNLNCKTISDDGVDIKKPPSQPERKGSLETSLSLGTHSRPGAAKVISRGASEDGTSSTGHRVYSESAPDLQQIIRGQDRAMPTSQPIIESLANALGLDSQGVDVSALPLLPPPPSAIDELTVDNDDSRFITHGKHHRPSLSQPPSHSTISEECPMVSQQDALQASSTTSSASSINPSPLSTSASTTAAPQQLSMPTSEKTDNFVARPEGEAHAEEKDETDSGYRSGTIPDDKLPKVPSQATLDRQELKRKITKYNHFVPTVHLEMTGKESFQGFLKVCMNLIRPITMELGARPPSIYELLTKEHIIEENTQQVAFYMPRDTYKSLHVSSETTTKELVSLLLKKFHILDHPRKFAMYEQEFSDNNKLVRLRRLGDKDHPLCASLTWNPERFHNYRMVLQENETGEIVWDAFSLPELNNFLKVLDREEKETIMELKHKYVYMRQLMMKRLTESRGGKQNSKVKNTSQA